EERTHLSNPFTASEIGVADQCYGSDPGLSVREPLHPGPIILLFAVAQHDHLQVARRAQRGKSCEHRAHDTGGDISGTGDAHGAVCEVDRDGGWRDADASVVPPVLLRAALEPYVQRDVGDTDAHTERVGFGSASLPQSRQG